MRPLETVLIAAELIAFLALVVTFVARRLVLFAVGASAATAVAQIVLEGFRWQMVPGYAMAAALLLAVWLVRRSGKTSTHPVWRIASALVGSVALACAATLPIVLPVFHFPVPTGPYGIGTLTYHWIDSERAEMFTDNPDDRRELMVQVWYPRRQERTSARGFLCKRYGFLWRHRARRLAELVLRPSWLCDHSCPRLGPAAGGKPRIPVLIFSTGRGGYRSSSIFEIEELVSHGYVVAGIDHPYTASGVIFPDGRDVKLDRRVARSVVDEHIVDDAFMLSVFDVPGEDAVFALDQLGKIDAADPDGVLTGRLDLDRAGIFGTSLGGITGAEACRLDHRFKACLILDVAMPPDVVASGLTQPTMWISRGPQIMRQEGWSESAIREHQTSMQEVFDHLANDGYLVLLAGMYHVDMTDFPAIVPPPLGTALGALGPADWQRTHAIINAYSLAFFDTYLGGGDDRTLASLTDQFSEVQVELHHP